ncbi:MAG: NUDIX hydrolase [Candidatus Omnitrophica bacterium]|jgi:ADP-ribose pyrophosphatase|nr:NUDIX hydrolase [Candidatus Omnitrophota bacterium]MDD3275330.1 NUDIX hydrolase [Candidatus Omnitrophota bacterium]MDD5725111.1 NUDIX hydrolase [Candidatus Omnitrophota bacterium]
MKMKIPVIKHPGAALIVPFIEKDKVILLRQFRPVIGRYLYELPAGTREEGESLLSCARRELAEETGYSASGIARLGYIYPVPGYSTEKIVIYRACGLKKSGGHPEKDEVIRCGIAGKAMVRKLFLSGKINDAKTICAFSICGWL